MRDFPVKLAMESSGDSKITHQLERSYMGASSLAHIRWGNRNTFIEKLEIPLQDLESNAYRHISPDHSLSRIYDYLVGAS